MRLIRACFRCRRVEVERALLERALVDPHVGDLAERLLDELEGHGDQRGVGVGGEGDLGHAVVVVLGEDLAVERAGQVAADRVEQRLHALVLVGRADHHRADLLGDGPLADRLVDQVEGDLLLLEQQLHDLVGDHREGLEHPLAGALGGLGHVGRDRLAADVLALLAVEVDRPSRSIRSMTPWKFDSAPIGSWSGIAVRPSLLSSCWITLAGLAPVRSILLMNAMPRHGVPLHLAVDGDRLRLHAGDGAEHEHGAVEDAERPLDLDGEVDVARGVDDVDLLVLPVDRGGGRGDRDPPLLLQLHVVHHRAFTLDLLDHVGAAGVVRDALGERGLARVDVGGDADVPDVSQVFHDPGTLSRQSKGGTPFAWATNHTTNWTNPVRVNPQFQHGLQGMPGSQDGGTPKNRRSGSLICFGVAHEKSPCRADVER